MTDQQADDLIAELLPLKAEGRHILDAKGDYIAVVHGFEELASRRAAALVERVSRQPQELEEARELAHSLTELLYEAGTGKPADSPKWRWLWRAQSISTGIGNKLNQHFLAASVSHQPVDAPIAPVVVNSQQEPSKKLQLLLNGWRELGEEMERIIAAMSSSEREDFLPDWFAPRLKQFLGDPAAESHQQEPPQEPALRRDPCGCLHDGSRIVEWCTRSGQTHEGHEERNKETL